MLLCQGYFFNWKFAISMNFKLLQKYLKKKKKNWSLACEVKSKIICKTPEEKQI